MAQSRYLRSMDLAKWAVLLYLSSTAKSNGLDLAYLYMSIYCLARNKASDHGSAIKFPSLTMNIGTVIASLYR